MKTVRLKGWRVGSGWLVAVLVAVLSVGVSLSEPAAAHEGHSGPLIEYLKTNDALRAMLPQGAKVTRRKQETSDAARTWAEDAFGIRPAGGMQTYYLARDSETGVVTGAAMVQELKYGHGELHLAIGVDPDGNVTRAAVLAVHRKYVAEVKGSVGSGFIDSLSGVDIGSIAGDGKKKPPESRKMFARVAATVAALLHDVE
ncbi:MAG: hypothetical protein ACE5FN_02175 [Leptospirillia bacterium]